MDGSCQQTAPKQNKNEIELLWFQFELHLSIDELTTGVIESSQGKENMPRCC